MLPATLAHDVRQQILHYLGTTFNLRDPDVRVAATFVQKVGVPIATEQFHTLRIKLP